MKIIQLYISVIIFLTATGLAALPAGHKEVSIEELRNTPEEFSNRNITITTNYKKPITRFPGWLIYMGFAAEKYYYLKVTPNSIPLLLKKKSSAGKSFTDIKKKSKVIVYGRVKKFRKVTGKHRRKAAKFPQYYLEVDKIELASTSKESDNK